MGLFRRKKKQQDLRQSQETARPKEQKVFSYYTASHKQLNAYERTSKSQAAAQETRRHMRNLKGHWFAVFVFAVLICSSVYLVSLSATPQVVVLGTAYRSEAVYQSIAQSELQKSLLNYSKPTLQQAKLEQAIKLAVPEAKSVNVSAPLLGRRPVVQIAMDEPRAVLKQPSNQDLIVSERGRLLLAANQSAGTTDLPVILNESTVVGKEGEQFIRPDDMANITKLFEQINLSGSSASYILPIEPREFVMVEPSRGAYTVRFLLGDTMLEQYGSLRAAQNKMTQLGQKPAEYVDVRLATKVFYK